MKDDMDGKINDGGPAYPVFPESSMGHAAAFKGVTMRDYFAAHALIGEMANRRGDGNWPPSRPDEIAITCYATADAMMKVREAVS